MGVTTSKAGLGANGKCGSGRCGKRVSKRSSGLVKCLIDNRVVAADVNKRVLGSSQYIYTSTRQYERTHLCQFGCHTAHMADVDQVWLRPERSQPRRLERFPPLVKVVKALTPASRVDLQLKLADG